MKIVTRLRAWTADQMSDRAALGLKLLGILLAVWVLMTVAEAARDARIDARAARDRLASLGVARSEDIWQRRAERVRAVEQLWQTASWAAPTPGVAAAEIQSRLEAMANRAGVESMNATVSPEALEVDGRQVLDFDYRVRGDRVALLHLLADLSLHSPRLIPVSINARLEDRRGTARLSGWAPYREGERAPQADAASAEGDSAS